MQEEQNTEKIFGLIGFPLTHSFSKKYFTEKFQRENINGWKYDLFPIKDISELPGLLKSSPELAGLNVTIPYKEAVIPYLDEMDEEARNVGAVNTISVFRDEDQIRLKGHNTDIHGFKMSLTPLLQEKHKSALILGTGGASKAAAYVLSKMNIDFQHVSRTAEKGIPYENLDEDILKKHLITINTTPLGMYPIEDICPEIPYQYIGNDHICFDMIYNPEETLFLKKAKEQGAMTKNGLEMLYLQAEKAWEIISKG